MKVKLLIVLLMIGGVAEAKFNKCKIKGKVVYQQKPCGAQGGTYGVGNNSNQGHYQHARMTENKHKLIQRELEENNLATERTKGKLTQANYQLRSIEAKRDAKVATLKAKRPFIGSKLMGDLTAHELEQQIEATQAEFLPKIDTYQQAVAALKAQLEDLEVEKKRIYMPGYTGKKAATPEQEAHQSQGNNTSADSHRQYESGGMNSDNSADGYNSGNQAPHNN